MNRIRKAIVAGAGAAAGSFWSGYLAGSPASAAEWIGLVGASVTAGLIVGYATWRIPNAR